MNDAVIVCGRNRRSYHLHIFKRLLRRKSSVIRHQRLKRHTLDEFHHDEGYFFFEESEVWYRDDVGVTDCGSGHRLLMKPLRERRVVTDELGFYDLDRASCFQESMMGFVDNSHPAFAEPAFENILPFQRD